MEFDTLIKKMSDNCRQLFEQSVATASSRSHFSIDVEHWLNEAVNTNDNEVTTVLNHFAVDQSALSQDLLNQLEALKTGHEGFPKISTDITRLLFEAWMIASTEYGSMTIRPIHILLAIVDNSKLRLHVNKISTEFEKITAEEMREQCEKLLSNEQSLEQGQTASPTKTPALDQFTINLTESARAGKIDRVLGRDNEIRQMIDVLCRRRQNNPIITGEAGVGKTALVEGLAERIASGDVPDALSQVELHSLDLGLLQAGAGIKGEFENRLKNVIKEVQSSAKPIILFIDEAHTLIGAGNQSGANDAANLLKPALARGELRTIAATTWAEYKKYVESDAALTRRFQVVKVDEPSEAQAIVMLRSMAPSLEKHHNITILDEAIVSAVVLSHRYIPGRQLPDKCVSLLDTACARVNLSLNTKPAKLENTEKTIANVEFEIKRLTQEQRSGVDHSETLQALNEQKESLEQTFSITMEQWQSQKELVNQLVTIRKEIEKIIADEHLSEETTQQLDELKAQAQGYRQELRLSQVGGVPMIYECVDSDVVAEVIADWTGIPVGKMKSDDIDNVLGLAEIMKQRVIGQDHGLDIIAQAMKTAHAKLSDPNKPLGIFMLVGPSGVGKTETALTLASQLYGSESNMTVINMSEFKEEHKISMLLGSPPGYVGYGEGGVLTEAVRRKPYSVVLLDEMEKAHPGVQDIFYRAFDKGILTDGEGRDIDFKNTVIIMTSNTASAQIEQLCSDPDTAPTPSGLLEAIGPTLREDYKPAFLGRVCVVPYYPLNEQSLAKIAELQLNSVRKRVQQNYQVPLNYSEEFIQHVVEQCKQSDSGARQIAALLNNILLPDIATQLLEYMAKDKEFSGINITISEDNQVKIDIESAENSDPVNRPA